MDRSLTMWRQTRQVILSGMTTPFMISRRLGPSATTDSLISLLCCMTWCSAAGRWTVSIHGVTEMCMLMPFWSGRWASWFMVHHGANEKWTCGVWLATGYWLHCTLYLSLYKYHMYTHFLLWHVLLLPRALLLSVLSLPWMYRRRRR